MTSCKIATDRTNDRNNPAIVIDLIRKVLLETLVLYSVYRKVTHGVTSDL